MNERFGYIEVPVTQFRQAMADLVDEALAREPGIIEYPRTDVGDPRNPWKLWCLHCNTCYHGQTQQHVHEWLSVHQTGRDLAGRVVGYVDGPNCKELQRLAEDTARHEFKAPPVDPVAAEVGDRMRAMDAAMVGQAAAQAPDRVVARRTREYCPNCRQQQVFRYAVDVATNICRNCNHTWRAVTDGNG